jgi:RHS repeat-associated protein
MIYVRENSTSTNELAFYVYDTLSRRYSVCMGAYTTTSCQLGTWNNKAAYGYEPDGQLNSLTQTLNGTTVSLGYGRNHSYQITGLIASDAFYLPTPGAASSTPYVPNALNQYGSVSGQLSTYDTNGNLLTWFPANGKSTYTYDSENRLLTAAVAGSATATISYDYDALGRRASKTVTGLGTTSYLLDGDEEIAESSGGIVLRHYVTGPGVDDRVARAETSATTNPPKSYYHTNHQGSVIAATDAAGNAAAIGCAAGVTCQRMSYDEYGSGSAATGEQFGFAGRRFDPETGLYYYRARYYSPQLGRFLQVDPVGYKDDLNLYAYVGNDPLDKTDPTGQWAVIDDAIAIGAGALVGFAAQGIEDLTSGHLSSPSEYAASAAGGALGGEIALYALPTLGPAGLGGAAAVGSAAADSLKSLATGKSLDAKGVGINAFIAAATAFVPGAKSAAGALAKQIATKAEKGLIKSATNGAAAKAIGGKAAGDAGGGAAGGFVSGVKDKIADAPASAVREPTFSCGTPGTITCGK